MVHLTPLNTFAQYNSSILLKIMNQTFLERVGTYFWLSVFIAYLLFKPG